MSSEPLLESQCPGCHVKILAPVICAPAIGVCRMCGCPSMNTEGRLRELTEPELRQYHENFDVDYDRIADVLQNVIDQQRNTNGPQ